MGGGASALEHGRYGTQGVAHPNNRPGARRYAAAWVDPEGTFWLFGGWGYAASGQAGYLDDLWKFDGTNWTWVSGASWPNQPGAYSAGGSPGARELAAGWVDRAGALWLFGGYGFAKSRLEGYLSDVWKFDGQRWTWVGGADTSDQPGWYGDGGTPGARASPATWVDERGAWLFGGRGYGEDSGVGDLDDLWRFEGTSWAWVSGSPAASDSLGVHGTKGSADAGSTPGGLQLSATWSQGGALWLFGGDEAGLEGSTDELWRFDGTSWTWVTGTGASTPGAYSTGTYGQRGVVDSTNSPGSRRAAIAWADRCENLWLAGGYGWGQLAGSAHGPGPLNDVWRFDGTNWTWMGGSSFVDQPGSYPVADGGDGSPGARYGAAWWVAHNGDLWVFGGMGIDGAGRQGELNDLWRYRR